MSKSNTFSPLLTKLQKGALCQMAKNAYDESGSNLNPAEWRRQQQLKVCGKASLTNCNQDDYRPLANHFVAIKNGGDSKPVPTGGEDWPTGDSPAKLWDKQIGAQIRKIGKLLGPKRSWAYANAMAKRICKVEVLDWCTSADLRKLIAALNYDRQRKPNR
jgi:hypothetical protein